jgi:hypothetical protein
MKNQIILFGIGLILFSISCKPAVKPDDKNKKLVKYSRGKQKLNINKTDEFGNPIEEIKFVILGDDTIKLGKEALFKVALSDDRFKIVKGYFKCTCDENNYVDTVNYSIDNCLYKLRLSDDTLQMAFVPSRKGEAKFHDIIPITKDRKGYLRASKVTLNYFVKSFSQIETVSINEQIKVNIDTSLWMRSNDPEMKFGWNYRKAENFFMTFKTVRDPNVINVSPKEFILGAINDLKSQNFKDTKVSSLETIKDFIYYTFSYNDGEENTLGAFVAYNKDLPYKFIIVFGAENLTPEIIKGSMVEILNGIQVSY